MLANKKFWAGGFLYNPKTNSVLLHQRDDKTKINPNKWAFFGGLNESNETPEETFIREIKEELNLDLLKDNIKHVCDYLNVEMNTYRYVFYVESVLEKSEMRLGEGANFDWIPVGKVMEYDLTEKTRIDLEKFLK